MIFVTVGTHEQPFNRLVEYMDRWAGEHDEEVIMQTGFTKIEPVNCKWFKITDHDEFMDLIGKARIVVTHGGPCCFSKVLKSGKIPVVVPRSHKKGEHIDDHQIEITRAIEEKYHNIILIEDIEKLGDALENYDSITAKLSKPGFENNNREFCDALSRIVDGLFD